MSKRVRDSDDLTSEGHPPSSSSGVLPLGVRRTYNGMAAYPLEDGTYEVIDEDYMEGTLALMYYVSESALDPLDPPCDPEANGAAGGVSSQGAAGGSSSQGASLAPPAMSNVFDEIPSDDEEKQPAPSPLEDEQQPIQAPPAAESREILHVPDLPAFLKKRSTSKLPQFYQVHGMGGSDALVQPSDDVTDRTRAVVSHPLFPNLFFMALPLFLAHRGSPMTLNRTLEEDGTHYQERTFVEYGDRPAFMYESRHVNEPRQRWLTTPVSRVTHGLFEMTVKVVRRVVGAKNEPNHVHYSIPVRSLYKVLDLVHARGLIFSSTDELVGNVFIRYTHFHSLGDYISRHFDDVSNKGVYDIALRCLIFAIRYFRPDLLPRERALMLLEVQDLAARILSDISPRDGAASSSLIVIKDEKDDA